MNDSKRHYPIGGSTAKTWMNCPAAPWLSMCAPLVKENEAMARGTRIHGYAEDMLNGRLVTGVDEEYACSRRYVRALRNAAPKWYAELPVADGVMAGTTIDATATDDHNLWIVDLKTGQEYVDPRHNAQLIFSLTCYCTTRSLRDTIHLGIYQELDDGTPPMRWWVLTREEAMREIAAMRRAIDKVMSGGAPTPGKHCGRCRAQGVCGVAQSQNTLPTPAAAMMSPVQAASAMALFPRVRKWMDSVEDAWADAAKSGQLPGVTAKPRKSALKWTATEFPDAWCEKKPMTPTQVVKGGHATEEELVSKGLAVRPPDGYTLVFAEQPAALPAPKKEADF